MKSFGVEKPKWQRIKFHVTKIFIQRKRPSLTPLQQLKKISLYNI